MANFKEHVTDGKKPAPVTLTEVFNTYRIQESEYGSFREKSGEYTKPRVIDAHDIVLLEDTFIRDKHTPYDALTRVILVSGDVFYAAEQKGEIKQKIAATLKP
jgi:hypothetical protein